MKIQLIITILLFHCWFYISEGKAENVGKNGTWTDDVNETGGRMPSLPSSPIYNIEQARKEQSELYNKLFKNKKALKIYEGDDDAKKTENILKSIKEIQNKPLIIEEDPWDTYIRKKNERIEEKRTIELYYILILIPILGLLYLLVKYYPIKKKTEEGNIQRSSSTQNLVA